MPRRKAAEAESNHPEADSDVASAAVPEEIRAMSFEQAVEALEGIVAGMEAGDMPLQRSLEAYERGAALVAHCRDSLERARQQVRIYEDGMLRPFDPEEGARE